MECDSNSMVPFLHVIFTRCTYMIFSCLFRLTRFDSRTFQRHREEHIQRKIDLMVKEAKDKMAKKDKKGKWTCSAAWA